MKETVDEEVENPEILAEESKDIVPEEVDISLLQFTSCLRNVLFQRC